MEHLANTGLLDNTIVLFSSDHGAYHGEYGLREKAPGICSESVCRIPLLWHVPKMTRPGSKTEALVETVDFAPTLASLCGLPAFDTADGFDITGLLNGSLTKTRDAAFTENPWSKAVRWDKWRMTYYPESMFGKDCPGELYDLSADPDETENLYSIPQYAPVVATGRSLLLDWLVQTARVVGAQTVPPDWTRGPLMAPIPQAENGRALNSHQPRFRRDLRMNYL
jgi:arylsulfatase A-like enzyme